MDFNYQLKFWEFAIIIGVPLALIIGIPVGITIGVMALFF